MNGFDTHCESRLGVRSAMRPTSVANAGGVIWSGPSYGRAWPVHPLYFLERTMIGNTLNRE
jgi:hypothetical protein